MWDGFLVLSNVPYQEYKREIKMSENSAQETFVFLYALRKLKNYQADYKNFVTVEKLR